MFPLKDNIPLARFPVVTAVLVAINVVVYLLEIRHGGSFFGGPSDSVTVHYGAIPYELTHPGKHCDVVSVAQGGEVVRTVACQGMPGVTGTPPSQPATWTTVFSSMFMHGSFLHIAGNMLFLVIFGPNVEDATGRVRYLVFYLLGGIVALAAQVLVGPNSTAPTLGASGAIAAVLGGYLLLYPRARVLTLIFIVFFATVVELPAVALLGVWFLEQLWFGASGLASPIGGGGGVAYFAHVGGFVFGLALIKLFVSRDRESGKGLQTPPRAVY
ncbi:MAG TPA: rhomboid family intramembrane serine protease [Solirubrobacteraceae bacterium]|jgi:membrane associated rhomboid family serine protease|nr:rhomboid family intramembrane serine protease [Solirubrobacteraceae bacterium]